MSKLLLVEDDYRLSQLISAYLTQQGFDVIHIDRGDKVEVYLAKHSVDIVVLDVMLPGVDGFTLCKRLRPDFSAPIILLTAKTEDYDQVMGLDIGADDYIAKPVEPRVLLARINALLRRVQAANTQEQVLSYGQLELQHTSRQVSLNKQDVALTSHEFDLLWLLASHAGAILDREFIHKQTIGREYDGLDRTVDVRVSRLRRKLLDNLESPFKIKTVWGKGYLFVADAWG